jgi:predicted GIY-YIG superfamily endonuclease
MKVKICDKNKCGIYLIRNLINGKIYIGKSNNIYVRITSHICNLNAKEIKKKILILLQLGINMVKMHLII